MSAPDLMDVCVALMKRGAFVGARFSAGAYTPAVPDPDGYAWCVLDLQGAPVALAHDAFDAAQLLARLEAGEASVEWYVDEDGAPLRMISDAEIIERDRYERLRDLRFSGWL